MTITMTMKTEYVDNETELHQYCSVSAQWRLLTFNGPAPGIIDLKIPVYRSAKSRSHVAPVNRLAYEYYQQVIAIIKHTVRVLLWCVMDYVLTNHDDVIKWKHFPRCWPFVREFTGHRWIPLTKASDAELWCFHSLICVWMNNRVNNREAGDLRRHRAHYDVTVMDIHTGLFQCLWDCQSHIQCYQICYLCNTLVLSSAVMRDYWLS